MRAPASGEYERAMQDHRDARVFCLRELLDFQVRAVKLQADTAILIAGTKNALADSRWLIDRDPVAPRPADEPLAGGIRLHREFIALPSCRQPSRN